MRSFALHHLIRGGVALAASSAIVLAVAAPGSAATTPLAYADANGLNLSILGSPISSGTVVSTTDGKTTTNTGGDTLPDIQALGNQSVIPATAVIAQSAYSSMNGLDGVSQACAGLAGGGSGVVTVGGKPTCELSGGIALNAGSVDLTGLKISSSGILTGLTTGIQNALQPLLTPVLGAVSQVLQAVASQIPLSVELGAVTASCNATPTTATGNGSVAGLSIKVALPAPIGTITIPLTVGTAPNTHVLTNLDAVVAAINKALTDTLTHAILTNTSLGLVNTALAAIGTSVNQVLGTLNTNLIAVIAPQLAPLEQNVLDGIINAQSSTPAPHPTISVTALDLKVLPVLGSNGIDLRVAKVDCGPNYRGTADCATTGTCPPPPCTSTNTCPTPPCATTHTCPPPKVVPSGLAAGYLPSGPLGMALLGLTVVAAAGAGVTAGARALRKGV